MQKKIVFFLQKHRYDFGKTSSCFYKNMMMFFFDVTEAVFSRVEIYNNPL